MSRARQPLLFPLAATLPDRLGPEFPGSIPEAPGVYFFRDREGTLLYIGQSGNLRRRVSSYRHVSPDRHPRRTLRLVHRIARVDWRVCATPEEAEALESTLLLEYRPPFNRAGTWKGAPWWFTVTAAEGRISLRMARDPGDLDAIGPLPWSFRYVFASLARSTARLIDPTRSLWDYPQGLFAAKMPNALDWPSLEAHRLRDLLERFARGESAEFLDRLATLDANPLRESERLFWEEEQERLQRFFAKLSGSASGTAPPGPESPGPR